jgi:hypothetical protein
VNAATAIVANPCFQHIANLLEDAREKRNQVERERLDRVEQYAANHVPALDGRTRDTFYAPVNTSTW